MKSVLFEISLEELAIEPAQGDIDVDTILQYQTIVDCCHELLVGAGDVSVVDFEEIDLG